MPPNEVLRRVGYELVSAYVQVPVLLPRCSLGRVLGMFSVDVEHCFESSLIGGLYYALAALPGSHLRPALLPDEIPQRVGQVRPPGVPVLVDHGAAGLVGHLLQVQNQLLALRIDDQSGLPLG